MSKLGKILTFVGISGAALAGFWYFLDTNKKAKREYDEYDDFDDEEEEEEDLFEDRTYVSLDTDGASASSDALKRVVTEAVNDMTAKEEEEAEGVGLVKEETDTKDFEFESFDKEANEE